MKHKHCDMIKAKAEDTSLIKIFYNKMQSKWVIPDNQDEMFCTTCEYFLSTKSNSDATLHLLNGGEIQFRFKGGDWMDSNKNGKSLEWSPDSDLMDYDYEFRIKPRKEKRWICITDDLEIEDGTLYESYANADENSPGYKQIVEIEVEVYKEK